jgi:hypothetical protein
VVHRIKFRIHGGQQPGKFVYNVPGEATLFLNPVFRPVRAAEAPSYSLRSSNGQTKITFHQSAGWNGKPATAGTYEVRAGHILTTNGITVEILECPELAASRDRENTQFLDLSALAVENSAQIESAPDFLSTVTPPVSEPVAEPPLVFRQPLAARKENFKRAALIASAFVGGMILANQLAQRFTFDIDAPEPIVNIVQVTRPRATRVTPVAVMIAQPGPEVSQSPPLEVYRAPASVPEVATVDEQRGAELAALGKELMNAVEEGNLKKVQNLIDQGGVSPDLTLDDLGRSPFVRAAAAGRVSIMQFLLTKKVAPNAIDFNGNNALMWSAINGHEKTAAYLLTVGIDPAAERHDGSTALKLAKQYRQKAIEGLLGRVPASAPQQRQ